jgi:hypothetical protein
LFKGVHCRSCLDYPENGAFTGYGSIKWRERTAGSGREAGRSSWMTGGTSALFVNYMSGIIKATMPFSVIKYRILIKKVGI